MMGEVSKNPNLNGLDKSKGLTIADAKNRGATHYRAMRDGVTPQLYYRLNDIGTISYISFTGSWVGSTLNGNPRLVDSLVEKLIKID